MWPSATASLVAVSMVGGAAPATWLAPSSARRSAALLTSSSKQVKHTIVALGDIAANACCNIAPIWAMGSTPCSSQSHLSSILIGAAQRVGGRVDVVGQGRLGDGSQWLHVPCHIRASTIPKFWLRIPCHIGVSEVERSDLATYPQPYCETRMACKEVEHTKRKSLPISRTVGTVRQPDAQCAHSTSRSLCNTNRRQPICPQCRSLSQVRNTICTCAIQYCSAPRTTGIFITTATADLHCLQICTRADMQTRCTAKSTAGFTGREEYIDACVIRLERLNRRQWVWMIVRRR